MCQHAIIPFQITSKFKILAFCELEFHGSCQIVRPHNRKLNFGLLSLLKFQIWLNCYRIKALLSVTSENGKTLFETYKRKKILCDNTVSPYDQKIIIAKVRVMNFMLKAR